MIEEIKVSQLPEASQINDDDLIMIVQNGANKKITKENCQFASGDEVAISTTEPSEDEKLWINPDEAPSGSLNPITNQYSIAQDKGYSCDYSNKYYGGTVLYSDDTGSNGEITLSDSSDNYSYVEIYYRSNDGLGYINGVKVPCLGYIIVSLNISHYITGVLYTKFKEVSLSNNKIQNVNYAEYYFQNGTTVSMNETNNIYITRVVGYK